MITVKNGLRLPETKGQGKKTHEQVTDPLSVIQQTLQSRTVPDRVFRFVGGAVGYISYDAVRYWERIPTQNS